MVMMSGNSVYCIIKLSFIILITKYKTSIFPFIFRKAIIVRDRLKNIQPALG